MDGIRFFFVDGLFFQRARSCEYRAGLLLNSRGRRFGMPGGDHLILFIDKLFFFDRLFVNSSRFAHCSGVLDFGPAKLAVPINGGQGYRSRGRVIFLRMN